MATLKTASDAVGSIAKIARPGMSRVYPRTRLFRLLDTYLEYPATWISAPGGSGKTTLTASYLTEKKLPAIWYQMDQGDADITTFFYYMGLAAAKAAPGYKTPLPLLTPEYLKGIETFTLRYFENLYSRLEPPFLIVLDNYQLVSHKSMLHQVVCAGIDAVPDDIKIMCISREDPPAEFARLRANERLKLLDAREIRFTLEETRGMMQIKGFEELQDDALQCMHERTGGWAAGLVLMMEGTRAGGFETVAPGFTAEGIFDYFAQELFEKTDPEMRAFLVKTSFFPKMTAPMAKELTGMADSEKKLNRLCKSNFFTYRDIQSHPSYEYHPLFREFLQSQAEELMTPEQVIENRTDSAQILEVAGQVEDAVRLLLSAQDWENVAPMILSHAPVIIRQERRETIKEWLAAFPGKLLERSPWLLYWMGVSNLYYSDNEAYDCFENAFHLFESQDDLTGTLLAWSGVVNSLLNTWEYPLLDPWLEWLDARIKQGLIFPTPEIEAQTASSMAGALVWRGPRMDDAREWLDKAACLSQQAGDTSISFHVLFHFTFFYFCIGDFAGLENITQSIPGMTPDIETSPLSQIYFNVSQAVIQAISPVKDDYGLQLIQKGLSISTNSGVHILDDWLFEIGTWIALNLGDLVLMGEYLDKLGLDLVEKPNEYKCRHRYLNAWRLFLMGDVDNALTDIEDLIMIAANELDSYNNRYMGHYFLSIILLKQKQYAKAHHHILSARALIPKAGEGYYWDYLCNLVEASITEGMGRKQKALACLKNAMSIARKRNYKTLFLFWQPTVLAHLCALSLENGIEVEHVKEMIRALDLPSEAAPIDSESWPWPVRIHTLGKFELYRDGNLVKFHGKSPKKPLHLLMTLLSMAGKDGGKDQLEDLLWPDADGDKAQIAFRTTLSRLRAILGKDQAILVHQNRVSLNPQYCWVDAWAFEKLADRVEQKANPDSKIKPSGAAENLTHAEKAVHLYGGKFLAGEMENDWILSFREHLQARFCRLVLSIGTQLEKAGNLDRAAACYCNALDTDDIHDEEIYKRLMDHYNQKGQSWKAMEVYIRLKRILASRFGIKPSFKMDGRYP